VAHLPAETALFDGELVAQRASDVSGDVIHVVAEQFEDLMALLRSVGNREEAFRWRMVGMTG
jgi:hypothetical protein